VERECTRLFGSHSELQQDVYELCELVLDIASNTVSRRNQARRDVDLTTDQNTRSETSQRLATRQFVVRFDYDPFKMSPNADPESELSLRAGDRVTVFGSVDSVSHCHLQLPRCYDKLVIDSSNADTIMFEYCGSVLVSDSPPNFFLGLYTHMHDPSVGRNGSDHICVKLNIVAACYIIEVIM